MSTPNPANPEPCPVARSAGIVADRWSLLIVRDAFDGVRRFSDFQRSLGIARNILSDRLHRLLDAGILAMQAGRGGGAHQEYALTAKGRSLFPVVVALRQWGEHYLFGEGEAHSELVEKKTGKRLRAMLPLADDGHAISSDETEVRKLGAAGAPQER